METKKIAIGIGSILIADIILSSSLLFFKNQNIDYINNNIDKINVNKVNGGQKEKIQDGEYQIKDINQSKNELQFTTESGDGLYTIDIDKKNYNLIYKDDIDSDKVEFNAPDKKIKKENDYISVIPDFNLYSDRARTDIILNKQYQKNKNEE